MARAVLIAGTLIALAILAERAWSQGGPNTVPLAGVWVVAICGTLPTGVTLTANTQGFMTVDTNGQMCVNK